MYCRPTDIHTSICPGIYILCAFFFFSPLFSSRFLRRKRVSVHAFRASASRLFLRVFSTAAAREMDANATAATVRSRQRIGVCINGCCPGLFVAAVCCTFRLSTARRGTAAAKINNLSVSAVTVAAERGRYSRHRCRLHDARRPPQRSAPPYVTRSLNIHKTSSTRMRFCHPCTRRTSPS